MHIFGRFDVDLNSFVLTRTEGCLPLISRSRLFLFEGLMFVLLDECPGMKDVAFGFVCDMTSSVVCVDVIMGFSRPMCLVVC